MTHASARRWCEPAAELSMLLLCLLSGATACSAAQRVRLQTASSALSIAQPALYPETLEVNPRSGKFLVSSVREGAVYEVGFDGAARPLVRDPKLSSVLGIAVDARSNRLLVTNSDLGAGVRRSARGPKQEAGVAAYDLATGEALFYADLSALLPSEDHLINGITVDANGNAYVTDSFSPTIYKVDRTGAASVFLRSEVFRGPAINLNGIVYHPRGFLLVVKKSTGELYRVPLDDPQRFSRIELPLRIPGGDGLLLVGDARLIVIANQTAEVRSNAAFVLATDDGWRSGRMVESTSLGQVYPTTCAALQNKVYVLSSQLDEWLSAEPSARASLTQQARQAEIRQLAEIIR